MNKFKVGDIVRFKGGKMIYIFTRNGSAARKGDVFIITAASGGCYSVKGAYTQSPNWSYMEEYFEFANITNWQEVVENEN